MSFSLLNTQSADRNFLLGELLKHVSRSFFLTLRILPGKLREPIGLAYLLARTADTIADTSLILPEHRITLLLSLRSQVNGSADTENLLRIKNELASQQSDSHEKLLLQAIEPMLRLLAAQGQNNRTLIREVLTILSTGMEFDLRTFPQEYSSEIRALHTLDELDQYTYRVAGCVGEFWTKISALHIPALKHWSHNQSLLQQGIGFGKALQMTNILRDCAKDLRIGRCYLPANMLEPLGLSPKDLWLPATSQHAQPVLIHLIHHTLHYFQDAAEYILSLPRSCIRLRLACLWPVLIGLETLLLLASHPLLWLDPEKPLKVKRAKIYQMIAASLPFAGSNTLIRTWIYTLIGKVKAQCSYQELIIKT